MVSVVVFTTRRVHSFDGEEGLRLAGKNPAEAVTLDVIMPTIDSCAVPLAQMANPGVVEIFDHADPRGRQAERLCARCLNVHSETHRPPTARGRAKKGALYTY